jgi:hypothetical protein
MPFPLSSSKGIIYEEFQPSHLLFGKHVQEIAASLQ